MGFIVLNLFIWHDKACKQSKNLSLPILSQSLVNCSCAKETYSSNPILLFCNGLPEALSFVSSTCFLLSKQRTCHYRSVQIFAFCIAASSILSQNDHLVCKLDFHCLCGSHYSLLVKKQLCHCVHHRAIIERLIPLAQSQLVKSNCVMNNTTVSLIQCFVKRWSPTSSTKVMGEHVVCSKRWLILKTYTLLELI